METNRKRVKVHMLPTESAENCIVLDGLTGKLNWHQKYFTQEYLKKDNRTSHHLYFTTDEEIKEGDPVVWNDKVERAGNNQLGRKIIATTDPKLIKDGVAQIPQAFIEKYCRVGGIDEVDVEYENTCCDLMLGCTKQCKGSIRLELKVSPNNEIFKMEANRKEAQVHILPTDKASIFGYYTDVRGEKALKCELWDFYYILSTRQPLEKGEKAKWEPCHLYFTTSEKIKEGDWCYDALTGLFQYGVSPVELLTKSKKIIATTDPELHKCTGCEYGATNGEFVDHTCKPQVAQPSQVFIEKYCKVGGIDRVLVEYEVEECGIDDGQVLYDIDNPVLKINAHNEITIHPIKESWTREEVEALIRKYQDRYGAVGGASTFVSNWIKENL